ESALYDAGCGMHDRGTNKGWMRSRSYYTKATKRPIVSAAVVAGLVAWAAAKRCR
ncbi:oxidoreductase, partial [Xanthomonas citri pv. citri]|nr:oxidoreductase [Xanthomonas citri pv. citri]